MEDQFRFLASRWIVFGRSTRWGIADVTEDPPRTAMCGHARTFLRARGVWLPCR